MIPGLIQRVEDLVLPVGCGVGRGRGWDLVLLWLWRGPAAVALIRSLAWEPPYAVGAALKRPKKKKKKKDSSHKLCCHMLPFMLHVI